MKAKEPSVVDGVRLMIEDRERRRSLKAGLRRGLFILRTENLRGSTTDCADGTDETKNPESALSVKSVVKASFVPHPAGSGFMVLRRVQKTVEAGDKLFGNGNRQGKGQLCL
jgi:hypothetical protein